MLVIDLIKSTSFEEVKKELYLSGRYEDNILQKFARYYEEFKNSELYFDAKHNKIQVNRENFETSNFIYSVEKDDIEKLITFVPAIDVLGSTLFESDLKDLSKELIVSAILNFLTFDGNCFCEEERKEYLNNLKEHIQTVSNTN